MLPDLKMAYHTQISLIVKPLINETHQSEHLMGSQTYRASSQWLHAR